MKEECLEFGVGSAKSLPFEWDSVDDIHVMYRWNSAPLSGSANYRSYNTWALLDDIVGEQEQCIFNDPLGTRVLFSYSKRRQQSVKQTHL